MPTSLQMPDKETLESWTYKDATGNHVPATPDTIRRWQTGLQQCLRYAIDQGFASIHVVGHFDPVHPVLLRPTSWRNLIDLAPQQKAQNDGLSYNDIILRPLTAALEAVASPKVSLWLSVSGEMGLSNFLNPDAWKAVLTSTRAQLKKKPWKVRSPSVGGSWDIHINAQQAENTFDISCKMPTDIGM